MSYSILIKMYLSNYNKQFLRSFICPCFRGYEHQKDNKLETLKQTSNATDVLYELSWQYKAVMHVYRFSSLSVTKVVILLRER